jgi:hypothetical protein
LTSARKWFDQRWQSEPGLVLLGKRLAEFYCFGTEPQPFLATIDHFASLTRNLPPGWVEAVRGSHGFFYWNPLALSSVRLWNRGEQELPGHCLHHWGHLLVNRLGDDGRLLPPWYDEAVAAWADFAARGQNSVFCKSSIAVDPTGTVAGRPEGELDPALVRRGQWRTYLKQALQDKRAPTLDKLVKLDFNQLELVDIATGMGIVEWLFEKDPKAMRAFHDALRSTAPRPPQRTIENPNERRAAYDKAFQAAVGMDARVADATWRTWFLSR